MPPPTPPFSTTLVCNAPGQRPEPGGYSRCGAFLGYAPGSVMFVESAERAPDRPDGDIWVRCTNKACKRWNRFRLIEPPKS